MTLLTTEQVAKRLGVNKDTVWRWMRAGQLPYVQVSRKYHRIDEADLDAFLESKKVSKPCHSERGIRPNAR